MTPEKIETEMYRLGAQIMASEIILTQLMQMLRQQEILTRPLIKTVRDQALEVTDAMEASGVRIMENQSRRTAKIIREIFSQLGAPIGP